MSRRARVDLPNAAPTMAPRTSEAAAGEGRLFARASKSVAGLIVARGSAAPASVVGEGAEIAGNLFSDGDVRVDGCVDGDVNGRKVAVGANGRVRGRIVADEAVISGTVSGGIAAQTVVLTATAKVACGIIQERLTVEAGAQVAGLVERPDMRAPRAAPLIDDHETMVMERVVWTRSRPERWVPRDAARVAEAAD